MAQIITADMVTVTADNVTLTIDGAPIGIPFGWPCAALPVDPPSVADVEAALSADDLLPQILSLAPRGPAWGTDEAGDGQGASPVQRGFWRALAAWTVDHLTRDWQAATQTFPSAVTYTLPDWERELGLPGPCGIGQGGTETRIAAVRARFAALGGQSPAYFTCLAKAAGYDITIEEPTQFLCDVSEVEGAAPIETWFEASAVPGEGGAIDTSDHAETWFACDEGACDDTRLEALTLAALGDGDPLEALTLAPGDSVPGDEVAGGLLEVGFDCDDGLCDDTSLDFWDADPNGTVWKFWIVHVATPAYTWFTADDGEIDSDPLEGFVPASDLECLLREKCPPHTALIFNYALAA